MLLSDLAKKEVLDAKANRIGTIVDVNLDVSQGTISHFVLRTGVLKKVPLTADKIDKIGEKIILRVNREDIEGVRARAGVK